MRRLVLLAALGIAIAAAPAAAARPSSLPETTPGASLLTASSAEDPGGPVAAIVYYNELPIVGDMTSGQSVAVGADRNTYRTIEPGALLSPDGTHAAFGGTDGTVRLRDLTTGDVRELRVADRHNTGVLAFSPDARYLVCGAATDGDSAWMSSLSLLDLRTGHTTPLLHRTSPTAAFSPDGERIAVQIDGAVLILDRAGHELARRPKLPGFIANQNAWSPDGRWLALSAAPEGDLQAFAPVDPAETATAPDVRAGEDFLGWRSPSEIVVAAWDDTSTTIDVRNIDGSGQRIIARTPGGYVYDVAGGLLPTLTTRPAGDPDQGPRPMWLWMTLAVVLGVVALAVWGIVRRVRRA